MHGPDGFRCNSHCDMIIMTVVAISADKIEGLADAYKTSTW